MKLNLQFQEFHEALAAKADLIQATGDAIVTFEEVACLTPRGKEFIMISACFDYSKY